MLWVSIGVQKKQRTPLLLIAGSTGVWKVSLHCDVGSSVASHITDLLREYLIWINVAVPHSVQILGQAFRMTMVLIISCIGWLWDIWMERNCLGFLNLPNNKNHLNIFLTSSQVYGHAAISSCRNGCHSSVSAALRRKMEVSLMMLVKGLEYPYPEKARCQKNSEAQGQSPQTFMRLPTPCPLWPMIASCSNPGWGCPISKPYVALNLKSLPNCQHLANSNGKLRSQMPPCKREGTDWEMWLGKLDLGLSYKHLKKPESMV